jgi:hypothetical protein
MFTRLEQFGFRLFKLASLNVGLANPGENSARGTILLNAFPFGPQQGGGIQRSMLFPCEEMTVPNP